MRDSSANLYVIYRYQVTSVQWDIAIARSTTGGASWNMTWQTGFASLPGTDFGNYSPCIAIDSKDNLHCAWFHRVASSGSRIPKTIRYNRYEAATTKWGTEWTVTPSAVYEMPNPILAVDQNDHVWFSHGISGWKSYLDRSDKPCASDGKFTRYSPAFSASNSQNVSLVADATNRIHMTYYDTGLGYAGVKHQWIDPVAASPTWSLTHLSNHSGLTARADYHSKMSADNAGNVYVIYNVDDQGGNSSRTTPTEFYVRKWDGSTRKWGNPVLVHSVPITVWHPSYMTGGKDYQDGRIISGACDETTGEFYFTYRDFVSGDFVLGRWRGDDTEKPTSYARLMNTRPSSVTTRNYFLYPHFRGSLWPRTNRVSWGLDLLYSAGDTSATTPLYSDYFEQFPVASMNSTSLPKIGSSYPIDLTSVLEGGRAYVAALTLSGLMPAIQFGRRSFPLAADSLFYLTAANVLPGTFIDFQGLLGAAGSGQAKLMIPNAPPLVGVKVDATFVTYDFSGIRAISNPWGFTIN